MKILSEEKRSSLLVPGINDKEKKSFTTLTPTQPALLLQ